MKLNIFELEQIIYLKNQLLFYRSLSIFPIPYKDLIDDKPFEAYFYHKALQKEHSIVQICEDKNQSLQKQTLIFQNTSNNLLTHLAIQEKPS